MDNYNDMNYDPDRYLEEKKKKRKNNTRLAALFIVACIISFFAGHGVGEMSKFSLYTNNDAANRSIQKMIEIEKILEENYLWETDSEKMWDNAVKGFVYGLDDIYTSYMNSEEMSLYEDSLLDDTFDGIGVQIRNTEEMNVFVVNVFNGSPAEKAGLREKDIIVSADDINLLGMGIDMAVTHIRGESGTSVRLGVVREGYDEIIYLDVTRARIEYHEVTYKMLEDDIGYIRIEAFESGCDEDFEKYLDELLDKGMKSLIIDLRSNPGGYVYCALNIADRIMPKSTIIYTKDNRGKAQYHYSDAESLDMKVVILLNEESASASELLSGALQDTGCAVIVGKQSYGKGVVQTPVDFTDGSNLKYVCEEYFLPSGASVHNIGLTPDYEVEYGSSDEDLQLEKAIEVALDR